MGEEKAAAARSIRIVPVDDALFPTAAQVHAQAWRASHAAFCTPAFVAAHDAARQERFLRSEAATGKRLFLLLDGGAAVGVVSVYGALIENLYVLPDRQGRGYGTALLRFAAACCNGQPMLWVLENNDRAIAWYGRLGFAFTGAQRGGPIREREMRLRNMSEKGQ